MSDRNRARAFVAGADGSIGSHAADHCLALGIGVVATDDLSGGFRENAPITATRVQGHLKDCRFVQSFWTDHGPYGYVDHLGAYAAEGLSPSSAPTTTRPTSSPRCTS